MSGQSTFTSKTGYGSQSSTSNMMLVLTLFLLSFVFNSETKDINIASHNLHGFKTSSEYHKTCINKIGGIWMSQEHWLSNKQLPQLQKLNAQFFATSGMEDAVSAGVMRGRPHGGVAIAWSHDLNHAITPLTEYKHKRVVSIMLKTEKENIIFINVYMPFLDSRKPDICRAETFETLTMIETIVHDHPHHLFVIGGDLNCELTGNSPFDTLWNDFAESNRFTYCKQLFSSPGFTYHHESLGQKKFNDHFLVSKEIYDSGICSKHTILEDGDNPSDHLPISMTMQLQIRRSNETENQSDNTPTLKWSKVPERDKSRYLQALASLMFSLPQPMLPCAGNCHCELNSCLHTLQQEYDFLIAAIKEADALLPRHRKGREKSWWSQELSILKNQSIEIQRLWISEGRPGHGPTHLERLRVRAAYRKAIRYAQKTPKQESWNQLHAAMEHCDANSFWHSWKTLYNKNNSGFAPMVDGCTSKTAIAESFRKTFQRNSEPNNADKVNELNSRFLSQYEDFSMKHDNHCNCSEYQVTIENVIDAICGMQAGKCADADGLSAEHFHNAPLSLLHRFTSLFNNMLSHAFVPKQYHSGFMIPIIKDSQGSHSDVGNYRGITISPVTSKIFEHILKSLFSDHLVTSCYQFGFKTKKSTNHALHCLKETINYYVNHGSRVFCSFLDASKAFDRLVHSGLFIKLMDRNIPKIFLDVIISWHDGLVCQVRWDNVYSEWFQISAGVRQGGVLSPDFYSIYVDDLINILRDAGVGCYIATFRTFLLLPSSTPMTWRF